MEKRLELNERDLQVRNLIKKIGPATKVTIRRILNEGWESDQSTASWTPSEIDDIVDRLTAVGELQHLVAHDTFAFETSAPQMHYPYADGDIMVIGPGVVMRDDNQTIDYMGETYYTAQRLDGMLSAKSAIPPRDIDYQNRVDLRSRAFYMARDLARDDKERKHGIGSVLFNAHRIEKYLQTGTVIAEATDLPEPRESRMSVTQPALDQKPRQSGSWAYSGPGQQFVEDLSDGPGQPHRTRQHFDDVTPPAPQFGAAGNITDGTLDNDQFEDI